MTNNYWRTLRLTQKKPYRQKYVWLVIKLALLVLRLVYRLFDFFGGSADDD